MTAVAQHAAMSQALMLRFVQNAVRQGQMPPEMAQKFAEAAKSGNLDMNNPMMAQIRSLALASQQQKLAQGGQSSNQSSGGVPQPPAARSQSISATAMSSAGQRPKLWTGEISWGNEDSKRGSYLLN